MPEGAEVKLSANIIKPLMVDVTINRAITTASGRYASANPEGYELFNRSLPCKVVDIQTKGKFMYWTFDNDWYLFSTFGMTGQWSPQQGKHACFLFDYDSNGQKTMFFNDPRHFGTIKFVQGKKNLDKKLSELGWDPLSDDSLGYVQATRKVSNSSKPISQLLMDQKIFAGVGNYIRAEALYQARVSPWRPGQALSREELTTLFDALIEVMQESYALQGATIQTYATPYGDEGKYSGCFKVYGQKQDPLGNIVKKEITPEGRTIHWCPAVQN